MLRPGAATAATATACLLLAGCSSSSSIAQSAGDGGFVAGNGAVTIIPAQQRGAPVQLAGPVVGGGADYDVAAHRGTVFLLNVWGSWCAPCRREAPELEKAWNDVPHDSVQFLGINTRDDADASATAFERRFGVTYPSLRDPDGHLQLTFRTTLPPTAIPSTLVLDKQGRVAARIVGPGTERTFTQLVEQVRAEV